MRQVVLENPALLFLIIFTPVLILLAVWKRCRDFSYRSVFFFCGFLSIAVFIFINILNLRRPGILWEDEAHILAVGAAYLHGEPMYHSLSAPDLYSLVYGPLTYLVYVPFLAGFRHPIPAMRVGTVAINIGILTTLFFILRRLVSWQAVIGLLSVATGILLYMGPQLFGTRGDTWMLLCICVALLGAINDNWIVAAIVSGVFSSFAMGFKPTMAPIVLLLLAIVYRKHGRRALIPSACISVAGTLSVYLLRGISLSNYLEWLVLSDRRQMYGQFMMSISMAAIFLIAPGVLLLAFGARVKRRSSLGIVLPVLCGVALAACILTGSKAGAGSWHIWPMLPFLLSWAAYEASVRGVDREASFGGRSGNGNGTTEGFSVDTRNVVAAIVLAATVVTLRYGFRDLRLIHVQGESHQRAAERAAENAIDALTDRMAPGSNLAMGYGLNSVDYRSDLRFELSLRGQDDFFDEEAMVGAMFEGISIPKGVINRILGCQDLWMVPHGEVPFSTLKLGISPMSPTPYFFPDGIRLGFPKTHVLLEQGAIYDLWGCPSK